MSQLSWKEDADRRCAAWIDGHDDEAEPAGESSLPSSAGDEVQHYIADLLLLDALLASMADGGATKRESRIRRVVDAIHDSGPTPRPRARFVRWSSCVAITVGLLIAITLSWIQFAHRSVASEVLQAVNEVSSEDTDRIYTIQRVLSTESDYGLPYGGLYLRGRSGFVITWEDVVLGRNGNEFWLVAPNQQVTLSDDFHWIDAGSVRDELGLRIMQELSIESRHVPLVQLASVAELMQQDYDVTLSRGQLENRTVDLLVGQRRIASAELPAVIRLWSDVDSRIIRRAELSWGRDNAIILELAPAETVSSGWYCYQTHCDGVPMVHRISPRP